MYARKGQITYGVWAARGRVLPASAGELGHAGRQEGDALAEALGCQEPVEHNCPVAAGHLAAAHNCPAAAGHLVAEHSCPAAAGHLAAEHRVPGAAAGVAVAGHRVTAR